MGALDTSKRYRCPGCRSIDIRQHKSGKIWFCGYCAGTCTTPMEITDLKTEVAKTPVAKGPTAGVPYYRGLHWNATF